MANNIMLVGVLFVAIIILLKYHMDKCDMRERFSLSSKPMEHDNSMLNRNPYDDIDYITPKFTMLM
jgi:hypothetical protein